MNDDFPTLESPKTQMETVGGGVLEEEEDDEEKDISNVFRGLQLDDQI